LGTLDPKHEHELHDILIHLKPPRS